jgi:peptidoglycan/xylan/chitin deacetylase (PgdA/CDA1 family)
MVGVAHAVEGPAAVVLMYHRFGEDKYPSTNIRLDQIDAHIAYLQEHKFSVLPLADVVAALDAGTPLPARAVAITIDDAYRSVFTEALPRFSRADFSFTLFVATGAVDVRERGLMSWDEIRALAADGGTIGAHGHAHAHMPALSRAALDADTAAMKRRFQEELGTVPALFAYPFGEAGSEDKRAVADAGFVAAFGQNSGPVYAEADRFYLPRFAMNERYGAMDRFALVVNTRPLRAVGLTPVSPVLAVNPPVLGFSLVNPPDLRGLACYGPSGERLAIQVAGAAVAVTPSAPFPAGRARVNCTVRAGGAWYWWGHEMVADFASEGVAFHPRSRPPSGR